MDARVRSKVDHPMPEMAAFMANMRDAFGDACVDDAVRRGKADEPTFYVCENGRTIGTASPTQENVWRVNADIRDRHNCPGSDGGCVGQGVGCTEWLQRHAGKENM
ncbi:hypothetical protein E2553_24885 [Paraburkholderia dipogonis]|uniref:Uncharacterized protein n=1 Tax=Paraburkholderia dipogonis TaxID=1211383 RepID=A0A4Y8MRQ9_9BURK|nr:hypothetical protein [Paraburkholderia dipogonis]TFE40025.1 hypothetical protein E2553_24885 [Paraburkholderia dipogonis]